MRLAKYLPQVLRDKITDEVLNELLYLIPSSTWLEIERLLSLMITIPEFNALLADSNMFDRAYSEFKKKCVAFGIPYYKMLKKEVFFLNLTLCLILGVREQAKCCSSRDELIKKTFNYKWLDLTITSAIEDMVITNLGNLKSDESYIQ